MKTEKQIERMLKINKNTENRILREFDEDGGQCEYKMRKLKHAQDVTHTLQWVLGSEFDIHLSYLEDTE